jgi:GT2 family glycosyltransferase
MPNNLSLKIACVVVTFNRYAELAKTLTALSQQGVNWSDIIVINNNSTDGTDVQLAKNFPEVTTFNLSENIASAGGFAFGMRYSHKKGYDWVWLYNDDSRPVPGTLLSILPYLEKVDERNIGLLKIANKNDNNQAVLLYWKGVRKPVYVKISNELTATDLVTFDGCMVSKELMSAIGYCDPLYFMGTYEFDYCLRASDAGFGIFTMPNGLIEDGKLGGMHGTPPWRQYYNTRNHLWLAINRRSFQIFFAWFVREIKYTLSIIWMGNKKMERMLFKYRAIRDAVLNRRGKRYDPETFNVN